MPTSKIKNDLFLRTLKGEHVERPPVWMMRQAGRYLPDFMKLKEKYPFFERVQNPELAAEITVMPIDQVGVDVAILFSDILVIPQAMNCEVQMVPGKGPFVPNPIRSMADVERLITPPAEDVLSYVMDGIRATKQMLDNRVPLIGFAGSPWTILCYMVEGHGSKDFSVAKGFCFSQPEAAHALLQKITDITIDYLQAKVRAGADVIQVFDSWGGLLSPGDYSEWSLPYMRQIAQAINPLVPVILFGKGCWFALNELREAGANALGVDWTLSPEKAREIVGAETVLQGNFDPSKLLSPIPVIQSEVNKMIDGFGVQRYIANLGHGILPNIPVDHAKAFVDAVKNYRI
ncbi:MAG: uroporphyrinogen decarboxylase [Cryomorphaceae bacterium]|nr:uroporphyrinogen decarboxylase [Cryomorphaceae bacterium]